MGREEIMPDLKMSSFLGQFANTIQQTGQAVSGFAEKLYEAEAYNEVNSFVPKIQSATEDRFKVIKDELTKNSFTLDDNKNPLIGGRTVEAWLGESSDWYAEQVKWIDSNVKNP